MCNQGLTYETLHAVTVIKNEIYTDEYQEESAERLCIIKLLFYSSFSQLELRRTELGLKIQFDLQFLLNRGVVSFLGILL